METAARDFKDYPRMLAAAEKRFGPLPWKSSNTLILPPSFPYGGMENAGWEEDFSSSRSTKRWPIAVNGIVP